MITASRILLLGVVAVVVWIAAMVLSAYVIAAERREADDAFDADVDVALHNVRDPHLDLEIDPPWAEPANELAARRAARGDAQ